jgi:hypothetical protein
MEHVKDYLEYSQMPDKSFEKRCWFLSTRSARNITKEEDRIILLNEIETTIHVLNRFRAGKITKEGARSRIKVRYRSLEELRDIHSLLLNYKFDPVNFRSSTSL